MYARIRTSAYHQQIMSQPTLTLSGYRPYNAIAITTTATKTPRFVQAWVLRHCALLQAAAVHALRLLELALPLEGGGPRLAGAVLADFAVAKLSARGRASLPDGTSSQIARGDVQEPCPNLQRLVLDMTGLEKESALQSLS